MSKRESKRESKKEQAAELAAQIPPNNTSTLAALVDAWFAQRGWSVFSFQRAVWDAALAGRSGLLHANTGTGKTYAVWFAALQRNLQSNLQLSVPHKKQEARGLRVLWITPMRALAADTQRALEATLPALAPSWRIGVRSGDTSSAERSRQARALPPVLITTPESLSLLLSQAHAQQQFATLDMVIVDEWHELIGSKRGVQVQLGLARLRNWRPGLLVWGLSATLGNLTHARTVLLGNSGKNDNSVVIEGDMDKTIQVDCLIPANPLRFPWSGHLGMQMLSPVVAEIDACNSTLVFTNTRSQAELWYQNILTARPEWAGIIALHHSSLDRAIRDWVEQALKNGALKAVVCTASLDLGVDFLPVERVLQIGSAKGIARLLQRAGRSGHAPGRVSRITLVPTNSLELLEAAAAKQAVRERRIEARTAPDKPFDVLVQHLVTVALGGGFRPDTLLAEVRTAWSYRNLTDEEWRWALDFVTRGGQSLTAYPDYQRVAPDEDEVYRVANAAIARRHRMNIGVIVSDAAVQVKYMRGSRLGAIEESFIARLKPGDCFLFGGRVLQFIRLHEMTAYVKRAREQQAAAPRWQGAKMPLSSELAQAVIKQLTLAAAGDYLGPEMQAIQPLLELQRRWSALPTDATLLIESMKSREGWHLFVYPFAGRAVHMGLASLLAYRVACRRPLTFSISFNDYGFELLSAQVVDWADIFNREKVEAVELFEVDDLLPHVLASLNASQLAQQRFREIARIAGLVFQGYPGQPKSMRQLQASSSLFFEVFRKHDSENLLLTQAQREVLEQELALTSLQTTLDILRTRTIVYRDIARATPLGFALMVERFREKLSTEKLSERIMRMLQELEKAAAAPIDNKKNKNRNN